MASTWPYLENTSVLRYPASWTVTGSLFCLLHKKELCRFPGPNLLSRLPLLPSRTPPWTSTGRALGGKFLRSVKLLLIRTGKPRFFVSCETLDTGKWASPSSHLWCWGGGKLEDLQRKTAFLPSRQERNTKLKREKLEQYERFKCVL